MPSASPEPLGSEVTCIDEFQDVMSKTMSKIEDNNPICLDSDGEAEEHHMDVDYLDADAGADADEEDNMGDQEDGEEESLCRRYVQ